MWYNLEYDVAFPVGIDQVSHYETAFSQFILEHDLPKLLFPFFERQCGVVTLCDNL